MDERELDDLIAQFGQPLLRYCHHILCDYHEAQDAVQTTLLKAWEHWDSFQSGGNRSAWLYRLAYTTCVDIIRRRKRLLFPAPRPAPDPDYIGPELRTALGKLTYQERGLVFGRVMEERSYDELAEIYGIGAATLRKRYERARKKLAQLLTEQEGQYETGT